MKWRLFVAYLIAWLCGTAEAGVIVNIYEDGGNVVCTWNGSLSTVGATVKRTSGGFACFIRPSGMDIRLRSVGGNNNWYYAVSPGDLGDSGQMTWFTTTSGSTTFALSDGEIALASDYVSGSTISGQSVIENKTIADVGLKPGTHTWTMSGSGDTVQVQVVPEPSTAIVLGLGSAFMLWALRRFVLAVRGTKTGA